MKGFPAFTQSLQVDLVLAIQGDCSASENRPPRPRSNFNGSEKRGCDSRVTGRATQ